MATPIGKSRCCLCGLPAYRTFARHVTGWQASLYESGGRPYSANLSTTKSYAQLISCRAGVVFANVPLHYNTLQVAQIFLCCAFFLNFIVIRRDKDASGVKQRLFPGFCIAANNLANRLQRAAGGHLLDYPFRLALLDFRSLPH